jgi:hypothetical protein
LARARVAARCGLAISPLLWCRLTRQMPVMSHFRPIQPVLPVGPLSAPPRKRPECSIAVK